MDREQLQRRLMVTYLEEVDEYIRALDRDVVALEAAPPGPAQHALVNVVFRAMHSLKGASRAVSVETVERACHALEHRLAPVREDGEPLTPELVELLFAAVDALRDAASRLRHGGGLAGSAVEQLVARLASADPPIASPSGDAASARPEVLGHGATAHADATPGNGASASRPDAAGSPPEARDEIATAGIAVRDAEATVRVRADKLDVVLARSAELLVARGRLEARERTLAGTAELIDRLDTDIRAVQKPLRRLLRSASRSGDAGHAPVLAGIGVGRAYSTPVRLESALSRIEDTVRTLKTQLERAAASEVQDVRVLRQAAVPLDEAVHRLRMFPFGDACEGLQRATRDVAKASDKHVELVIEGRDVELDRAILDGLRAPLLHLVRNAVHHGIEQPDERVRAGKPALARITVAAHLRNSQVDITIDDDGRGLDLDAIRDELRRRRMPEPADPQDLARTIFKPRFSTATQVTPISGRGVGLDVVASSVGALHGTVDVIWQPGRGTRMTLAVPLTLTTIRALAVIASGQTFAFPGTNVHKVLQLRRSDLLSIEGMPAMVVAGRPIAVWPLADVLGMPRATDHGARSHTPAVVVASGEKRVAFLVDELLAEQEMVVKSLGKRLAGIELVAGASILPSGKLGLILNAAAVIQRAHAPGRDRGVAPRLAEPADARRQRLLVVDDVVTTRSLIKSLLEAAGYDVNIAADGADAWRVLNERGADVVVTDIEMPRMDGFELTRQIRGSDRFRDLPVVLITGLDSQRDKERGVAAGANAYLVKSDFDQRNLIDAIGRLV
jgi:two-component system chemotaxis sensor kinase CheA